AGFDHVDDGLGAGERGAALEWRSDGAGAPVQPSRVSISNPPVNHGEPTERACDGRLHRGPVSERVWSVHRGWRADRHAAQPAARDTWTDAQHRRLGAALRATSERPISPGRDV